MQIGDMLATVATPIARYLELPCVDPETQQLRPESRCNQWRQGLNAWGEAVYDELFQPSKPKEK
jgi:hypothetical protein